MSSTNDLVSCLTATLLTKAEEITVRSTAFDPDRRTQLDLDDIEREPSGARSRRVWSLAAAVLLAVAAAAGAVALVAGEEDAPSSTEVGEDPTTTTTETTEPSAVVEPTTSDPDGALLPTWVPDGVDLWDVTSITGPDMGGEWGDQTVQLFGDPDGEAKIAVRISPPSPPGSGSGGDPLTVRGLPATVMTSKYSETAFELFWQEDAAVTANFRGMSTEDAVAFLDTLQWRSANHQEGFVPPSDGSLPLLAEDAPDPNAPTTVEALLTYSSDPPTAPLPHDRRLEIRTTAPTGEPTSPDLLTWFYGDVREDGVAVWYDEPFGGLAMSWPDGRRIRIDTYGWINDPAVLDRIAAGIAPGTPSDFAALRATVYAQVLGLPVLATAELPSGTLTLRGDSDYAILCIADDCADTGYGGLSNHPRLAVVSSQVGGRWTVAAASMAQQPVVEGPEALPVETGTDGEWTFVLAHPPDGVEEVDVTIGNEGVGVPRPG